MKIENGEVDKIKLEIQLDFLNDIITQFRKKGDIVDSLILLGSFEKLDEIDALISTNIDSIYYESRRIICKKV